jgi:hypothetical protein
MPKLAFHIEADYQKVIKLREEIDKLKSTIAGMDSNTSPATFRAMEVQLAKNTKELDSLVTSAVRAGNEINQGFKKKIFDASQVVNGLSEKIITQKWIACWPEGMEAWAEQRRTGYPKLFKVQTNNSNGTIDTDIMIRRLPFSQDDAKKDPEQYKNLCTALGGADNGGTRLWWDTGKNNF